MMEEEKIKEVDRVVMDRIHHMLKENKDYFGDIIDDRGTRVWTDRIFVNCDQTFIEPEGIAKACTITYTTYPTLSEKGFDAGYSSMEGVRWIPMVTNDGVFQDGGEYAVGLERYYGKLKGIPKKSSLNELASRLKEKMNNEDNIVVRLPKGDERAIMRLGEWYAGFYNPKEDRFFTEAELDEITEEYRRKSQ